MDIEKYWWTFVYTRAFTFHHHYFLEATSAAEENSYFCFPVLNRPALSFIFQFETNWFLLGSPIWKPRDQGQDWEGSGSETGSEVRGRPPRSSSTNQRPSLDLSTNQRSGDSGSDQRKTVGFESSPQSNGKKETLQSACKRKWNVTSFL